VKDYLIPFANLIDYVGNFYREDRNALVARNAAKITHDEVRDRWCCRENPAVSCTTDRRTSPRRTLWISSPSSSALPLCANHPLSATTNVFLNNVIVDYRKESHRITLFPQLFSQPLNKQNDERLFGFMREREKTMHHSSLRAHSQSAFELSSRNLPGSASKRKEQTIYAIRLSIDTSQAW